MNDPYVVCLVPTRGDRPKMLSACLDMMSNQTLLPMEVVLINDPPVDPNKKDITWRYRRGIQKIIDRHPNVELILFIEDDDWYSPSYIQVFYEAWKNSKSPDIFGIEETYYYHISKRSVFHQNHKGRASAFCTGVSPSVISKLQWPPDEYSFIDLEMWKQLDGSTFVVDPPIAIGMKGHEEGSMFGGVGHNNSWNGYTQRDENLDWISSIIAGKYKKDMISFYFGNSEGPIGTLDVLGPKKYQSND